MDPSKDYIDLSSINSIDVVSDSSHVETLSSSEEMSVISSDHLVVRFMNQNGTQSYNIDGIANVLLALDRIEQNEELTYKREESSDQASNKGGFGGRIGIFHRGFENGSGIRIVEMLFRCNILVLVGGGSQPQYPLNKKISVYNFTDLKLLQSIETFVNPKGLCDVSQASGSFVLVCLRLRKGQVRVDHYALKRTKFILAHDSRITCFALSQNGNMIATTSNKGTLVRIFSIHDGSLLQEILFGFLYIVNLGIILFVYVDDSMDDIVEIPIRLEWNDEFQFCWNRMTNSNSIGITEVDA
ncbi:unnamed protein product [Lactuca saligna]|uniref:Autophagy-related protein 18a n=1 Tax=Lactuca saligna TaxID=75948 RepID=A0AA36EIB9_LACSI|nr:unnamed protein product [Lactuca saligna]